MKLPFCSIVILNYNGKHHLKECLTSLRNINYPKERYEVILVDNNSCDGSVEYVRKNFPWVKILKLDKNYGAAEGRNKAIEYLKKGEEKIDYIVFLDNDTKVEKNWLIELVKVAQKDEKIAVCGSKVLFYNTNIIQYAGAQMDISGGLIQGEGEIDNGQYEIVKDVFYAPSCSMLVKFSVLEYFKKCFDPKFFIYFEENDFCWRLKLLGYKIVYVPTSVIYHKSSAFSQKNEKSDYLMFRNKIWSFKKNLRFPLKHVILFLVSLRILATILFLMIKGKWHTGPLVLKHLFDKINNDIDMKKISLKRQLKVFSFSLPSFSQLNLRKF